MARGYGLRSLTVKQFKKSTLFDIVVVAFVFAAGVAFSLLFRGCGGSTAMPETTIVRDTLIIRDTIRPEIPTPKIVEVVRYDTIEIKHYGDTAVAIPITQKTYATEDYRAVVEGYNPRLLSLELYRETMQITNTVTNSVTRSPRWALTVGAGYGYTPKGFQPYVGAHFGFVIWSR